MVEPVARHFGPRRFRHRSRRVKLAALTRLLLAIALASTAAGCGEARSTGVVTVGDQVITRQDLQGWMKVIAPEHFVSDPPHFSACLASKPAGSREALTSLSKRECAQRYLSLKERALSFLVHCEWLLAESARLGLTVPSQLVRSRIESERGGLKASGATAKSIQLKVEAEVATATLRQWLHQPPSRATRTDALSYYRRHRQSFERPERRTFEIAEGLSHDEASKLLEKARRGEKVTAAPGFGPEEFPRSSIATAEGDYKILREAIFAATPHVLSGPAILNGMYTVFEVTRVTPAKLRPFAAVVSSIEKLLTVAQRRSLPTQFLAALRSRWVPKTDCHPGYVVQQCRQYSGSVTPEEPSEFE